MERKNKPQTLSDQMKKKVMSGINSKKPEYDGNFGKVISTGSTLLDLAVSGGQTRGGGLPGGILVEIFGPSGSGKTVLLSEIAGAIQREGGEVMFHDPEARLNKTFAQLFGLELKEGDYKNPNTVTEVFKAVRAWNPENPKVINGIFADSLAALSTDMEMEGDEGDKMGMRRAKEFSEQLRKTCRILARDNLLMVCSNQVRIDVDPKSYQKYSTPGGLSVGFYSSLRLKASISNKHKVDKTFAGKEVSRIIGVRVDIEVAKSSIWKPFHTAPVTILFDYGIDDIRENLQFIKSYTKNTIYTITGKGLDKSMEASIKMIEKDKLEDQLRKETIDLWEEIESKFESNRKPKR
jgi:recombination protein RecA